MLILTARWLARNVLGWMVIALGVLLSLPTVPGPGFAVIFAGLSIADWPGKLRFFRWMGSFRWFQECDRYVHQKFGFRLGHHGERGPDAPSKSEPAQEPTKADGSQEPAETRSAD